MTEKTPIHQRAWPVYTGLIFSGLSLLVAITGPATKDWLPVFRGIGGLLAQYGFYLAAVALTLVAYSRRSFLGRVFSTAYAAMLRFLLKPVLPGRLSDVPPVPYSEEIHYGQRFHFRHFTTGKFLTSIPGVIYQTGNGGSGQQMVFGASMPDANSVWTIKPSPANEADVGPEPKKGHYVLIVHERSEDHLHSHENLSPWSLDPHHPDTQREVSVCSLRNIQDNWVIALISIDAHGSKWRFRHFDGDYFLHSHDRPQMLPPPYRSNCFEVTTSANPNDDDFWILVPLGPPF